MDEARLKEFLQKLLGGRVAWNVPTSRLTTLGVGGPAWALARPETADELAAVLANVQAANLPYMAIGRGSNLLFSDNGFEGVLIQLGASFQRIEISEDGLLLAGGSARGEQLVSAALAASLDGLECLSGIPCTLGGALMMNAGGGDAIGDVLVKILYMGAGGHRGFKNRADLDIKYRCLTGLPEGAIILDAELQLRKTSPESLKARLAELVGQRKKAQPQRVRSAGCFFKNPHAMSAGRLIDLCGLKGRRIGGAEVSQVHANFLINSGGATAADFLALMDLIVEKVETKYGIILEPEVRILGRDKEALNE